MIRFLAGLACCLAIGTAEAEEVAVRAAAVPLHAEQPERREVGRLRFLGGFRLQADHEGFGGFSDIELSAGGGVLRSVSDYGWFMTLPLVHDAEGTLVGVGQATLGRLRGLDGKPLKDKPIADAEAMARLPDGSLVVAFERINRLLHYIPGADPAAEKPVRFSIPPGFADLPKNGGIETLAALPGNRLLAIAENGRDAAGDHLAWLHGPEGWSALRLVAEGSFVPTAAQALPSGDLILLERRFGFIGGFAARLSIVPKETIAPGARMTRRPLAELTSPLSIDNFEGVATRPAPDGSTLIYLLSDDNRNPLQWTLLLQFRLGGE